MAAGEIHIELFVGFGEHPQVRALTRYGKDARRIRDLYVQMLCYCKRNLSDGFVPDVELGVLVYPDSPRVGVKDAERLIDVGLVERADGGYFVPGFLRRNKSKQQVRAISEARAEAGKKGGQRSGVVRRGEAKPKQGASRPRSKPPNAGEANTKHVASLGLNTESETESQTTPPAGAAVAPPNAGDVVAAWIEGSQTATGERPAGRLIAQVGRQARELIEEGKDPARLVDVARSAGVKGYADLGRELLHASAKTANGKPRHEPYRNPDDPAAYQEWPA